MESRIRWAWAAVIAGTAGLLFHGAGSVPLLDPDEARFARTSVEMLRSGDFVVPHFEGQPRLVKPPAIHWIQAALFGTFGVSAGVARTHAALAALGSVLLAGWILARRFGPEGGVWGAACLATMPLAFVPGRLGTLDALLAVHVLAVIAIDLAPGADERPRAGTAFGVGAILGLAFLVKGPIAVVLPSVAMLAGRSVARSDVLPPFRDGARAAAGFAVVALPWVLSLADRVGLDAAWGTLREESLERYFAGATHREGPWFYPAVLAMGCLPWLAPLAFGLVRVVRRWRDPSARTARYAAAGLLAGVAFLSVSPSKVATYLAPLAPLAAVIVAWEIGNQVAQPMRRAGGLASAGCLAAIAIGCAGSAGSATTDGLSRAAWILGTVTGLGAAGTAVAALARRTRVAYATVALTAAASLAVGVVAVAPEIARTRTAAYLIETVPELRERPVAVVDMKVPSLTFYLDRPAEQVDLAHFTERLARDDDPLFVFDRRDLAVAPGRDALVTVGRQGKYVVLRKRGSLDSGPNRGRPPAGDSRLTALPAGG